MPCSLNTIRFLNTHSRVRHMALRVLAHCTWQGNKAILCCFTQNCISVFLLSTGGQRLSFGNTFRFFSTQICSKNAPTLYSAQKVFRIPNTFTHTHMYTFLCFSNYQNAQWKGENYLTELASGWVKSRLECEILHSGSALLKSLSYVYSHIQSISYSCDCFWTHKLSEAWQFSLDSLQRNIIISFSF